MFVDRFSLDLWSHRTDFIEPVWRTILSSKALLVVLSELFPGHANLLPASWPNESFQGSPHVTKPIHSREGANIQIVGAEGNSSTPGPYRGTRTCQAYAPLFSSHDRHAAIGAWMVGDTPDLTS
jgi:glutathionylspermidine synthase